MILARKIYAVVACFFFCCCCMNIDKKINRFICLYEFADQYKWMLSLCLNVYWIYWILIVFNKKNLSDGGEWSYNGHVLLQFDFVHIPIEISRLPVQLVFVISEQSNVIIYIYLLDV